MAQETRPRSVSRSFSEEEWEVQKEQFRFYYIEKGMSLKEAAQCMKDNHNFDATPRQWERRIAPDKWGFQKYESRESRLQQIAASGKNLLEVSSRGRRRSTASDGRPTLNEDRNMRRFARREVSRDARRRTRSVSEVSDFSDQESSAGSMPGSPVPPHMTLHNVGDHFEQGAPGYTQNLTIPNWRDPTDVGDPMNTMFNPSTQIGGVVVPQIFVSADNNDMGSFGVDVGNNIRGFPSQQQSAQFPDMSDPMPQMNDDFQGQLLQQDLPPFEPGWNSSFNMPNSTGNPQVSLNDDLQFNQNATSNSFDEMMAVDPMIDPSNSSVTNPSFDFSPPPGHVMQERGSIDMDPFDDPTHADVHALLGVHSSRLDEMVQDCIDQCRTARDGNTVLQHLKGLRFNLQAQNQSSHREIKMTLKNVASIQQRANQSMKDVCSNLRKKNEALDSQNQALMNIIQSQNPNPQPSFSPTHRVSDPWQMG